jgi:predicted aldo/keto reductase-like oxidoreductase
MPKRVLGRTKLSVSLLGFGCTQVKNKAVYQRAIELGVNYFHMGDRDPAYNPDQVEQNVVAVKQSLSEEDREVLQTMISCNSQRFCRMCGACEGKCPNGVDIRGRICRIRDWLG